MTGDDPRKILINATVWRSVQGTHEPTHRWHFINKTKNKKTIRYLIEGGLCVRGAKLTFHRFPHKLHNTNVVIGSSALRVCSWKNTSIGFRMKWASVNDDMLWGFYLIVSAVLPSALATLEHVGGSSTVDRHLMIVDRLLRQLRPQILHLLTRHFLWRHRRKLLGLDETNEDVLA